MKSCADITPLSGLRVPEAEGRVLSLRVVRGDEDILSSLLVGATNDGAPSRYVSRIDALDEGRR